MRIRFDFGTLTLDAEPLAKVRAGTRVRVTALD
jgi:hypothetical protein